MQPTGDIVSGCCFLARARIPCLFCLSRRLSGFITAVGFSLYLNFQLSLHSNLHLSLHRYSCSYGYSPTRSGPSPAFISAKPEFAMNSPIALNDGDIEQKGRHPCLPNSFPFPHPVQRRFLWITRFTGFGHLIHMWTTSLWFTYPVYPQRYAQKNKGCRTPGSAPLLFRAAHDIFLLSSHD